MKKIVLKMVLLALMSAPALGCSTSAEVPPAGPATASTGEVPAAGTASVTADAPLLTPDECTGKGAETIGDRGDGSTRRNGCPEGRKLLGNVRIGIEGGICCAK
jgi:hypothetical protein